MKKNIKYLILITPILFLIVSLYRFEQYMVNKNFVIDVNTLCDPSTENCFDSTNDLSFGQNPYKKVEIIARYAPKCLEEHTCESFVCPDNLNNPNDCIITYCSAETKVDGESCVNDKYNK